VNGGETAPTLRVMRLPDGHGLALPAYQTAGAAGLDLPAATAVTLEPGARALVPTGLVVAVPPGFAGDVRPRSGLALRSGVTLCAPGTIDSDYRGALYVLLMNLGSAPVRLERGDRIAQLVIVPVASAQVVEVAALEDTERGAGGFGHTGAGERPA
jgi:dUTP pyrophosphatase